MRRMGRAVLAAAIAGAVMAPSAHAQGIGLNGPELPANDFEATLALTGGKIVQPWGPAARAPQPPLRASPRAQCGAGSRPLEGMQGRVTGADVRSKAAERGWTCNLTEVGGHDTPGGFRTWRYTDRNGHTCAFYDSSIASPANIVSLAAGPSQGVVVLDMADPAHPRRTAMLTTLAMLSPHESLNLNAPRGLLAAVAGNAGTQPGTTDVYDVSNDCRHPELQSQIPSSYGHESGFAPDGRTFYTAGGAGEVVAIDLTNPKLPHVLWRGAMYSHGLNLSDDGNTLYQTDPINGNLGILDVSEIQARKPDPTVRQISRVTWDTVSIPQNTVPLTIGGRKLLLEFDEFAFRFNPATIDDRVGAARIFDIEDPAKPKVVSDLRLEVNQRENHAKIAGDPTAVPGPLTYAAHYCAAPREVDPVIVACSFINSGLRVFDVRDPEHPREVAYYVAPPKKGTFAGAQAANNAFSQPAFDPERREVWYTDATSGFHALRLDESAWPRDDATTAPTARCASKRTVTITLPREIRRNARVTYAGKRAKVTRRTGRLRARIDLRGRRGGTVTVRVSGISKTGRRVMQTRRFKTCRGRAS